MDTRGSEVVRSNQISALDVPLNDLSRTYRRYGSCVEAEVIQALRSGRWINGKRSRDFSDRFAEFIGVKHCIAVANGTDALELALRTASAMRPGHDEVVTAANAGGYTSTAAFCAGLKPVYSDIEAATSLLSVSSALGCITSRTLAVVVTHLYGGMADVSGLVNGLRNMGREDIFVIED